MTVTTNASDYAIGSRALEVIFCDDWVMIRLHCYSNHVLRIVLPTLNEDDEVWSLDQIKEFEDVSQAYKEWLADILEKGITAVLRKFILIL